MSKIRGACLCGSVRYASDAEPAAVVVCHCVTCQKNTGSAFSLNIGVPTDAVKIDGTTLVRYEDHTGASGKPYSFEGGHQLVMFADSKLKKAAWTFIEYLASSPDAMNKYTLGPGASLPSLSATPGSEIARKLDTPIYRSFTTAIIPTLATPPFGPAFASASSAISPCRARATGGAIF